MFTAKQIANLKPREKTYQVREGKGFGIRIFPSGEKTWFFAYKIHERARMMTLGPYPELTLSDAREMFEAARKLLKKGTDPLEAKHEERKEPTVSVLAESFLKRHVKEQAPRSIKEYRRNLEKDVLPVWGRRRAKDITKRDVIALTDAIVDRGAPNQANQVFKIIRKMFNFAVERDVVDFTPCAGVKLPSPEKKKDRFLSEEEIRIFLNELDKSGMSDHIKQALRLVLITGQRPGEVIGLHTREIEGHWWTIPPERAKNKREHRVFLTPMALKVLGTFEGYRFPSPRSKILGEQERPIEVNALAHAIRRNSSWGQKRVKKRVEKGEAKKEPFTFSIKEPWTPHDLRRSCATGLGRLGYTDELIGRVLNHVRPGVTAIYNRHRYDKEKQIALEAWSRKLEGIVGGEERDNLIPMSRS